MAKANLIPAIIEAIQLGVASLPKPSLRVVKAGSVLQVGAASIPAIVIEDGGYRNILYVSTGATKPTKPNNVRHAFSIKIFTFETSIMASSLRTYMDAVMDVITPFGIAMSGDANLDIQHEAGSNMMDDLGDLYATGQTVYCGMLNYIGDYYPAH